MKKSITIDEIKSNINLDISDRKRAYSTNVKFTEEDIEDIIYAEIKQEYEYWAKKRINISKRTDEMLKKVLNGHTLSRKEEFEMMCSDQKEIERFSTFEDLKGRVTSNKVISEEDFYNLCNQIGFDEKMTETIKIGFENKGLIVKSYKENKSK